MHPEDDPSRGGSSPASPAAGALTYADVSRGIQRIFKEKQEPLSVAVLEATFLERFGTAISSVVGISTVEYLRRKENVFEYDEAKDSVFLQPSILAGPPIADPNLPKDEPFVVEEFERLIEDLGPVCYVSALCGKFIQRNGISVTSITSVRPLDLLKKHPDRFLVCGGGHVSLVKFQDLPEVQCLLKKSTGRAKGTERAQQDAPLPVPEIVTEQHVVEEFVRLIQQDGSDSVYISSLCGRFLQRFKKPVTGIINSRPSDFLRKYPETFEVLGGGNVRLRQAQAEPGAAPPADARPADPLSPASNAATPPDGPALLSLDDTICSKVLERIAPADFGDAFRERAQEFCDLLQERSFLSIEETVLTGPVGKGLAVRGAVEADIVLMVESLPDDEHGKWLPHLLETLLAVLEMVPSGSTPGRAKDFHIVGGKQAELVLSDAGDGRAGTATSGGAEMLADMRVSIFIAQPLGPREQFLLQLRESQPEVQRFLAPSLAKDARDLVSRQPEPVRMAMKLVRWWAANQAWSSAATMPPSYLLELLVILAAVGSPAAASVAGLVEAALDHCAGVASLRVLWDGTGLLLFPASEISQSLLSQAPLVLDPTNPCANVADPQLFDGCELAACASRARPGGRYTCFVHCAE